MAIRRILKFGLGLAGFELKRKPTYSFEDITPHLMKTSSPLVFDVGANRGQSIVRYKALFPGSTIHCFEPNGDEIGRLKEIYQNDKTIVLNEVAVGAQSEVKNFFLNANSAHSSFNKLTKDTEWLKKRSKQLNIKQESYTVASTDVNVVTLDNYCAENKIKHIGK